jgi:segregation and condensation protein A
VSEANDLEVPQGDAPSAPPTGGSKAPKSPAGGSKNAAGAEATAPAEGAYTVRLPNFEGPLDLLLHLCQKHELNILDIPIAFITEKYLEYLAVMQLIQLDVAADYLLMAATLAHIKSKMLLPAPPPGQEDEDELTLEETDPREALIRRLLEYQKYKHAAEQLAARGVAGRDVFFRGAPVEEAVDAGEPPLASVPLFSLVEAFQKVLAKSKVKLTHDIVADRVSLSDRIHELSSLLANRKRVLFEEIFLGPDAPRSADAPKPEVTRFDLVITFLALLEMTRLRMTRLYQEGPLAPLFVELADGVTAPTSSSPELPTEDLAEGVAAEAVDEPTSPEGMSFADEGDEALAQAASDEPLDEAVPPFEDERPALHEDAAPLFEEESPVLQEEAHAHEESLPALGEPTPAHDGEPPVESSERSEQDVEGDEP